MMESEKSVVIVVVAVAVDVDVIGVQVKLEEIAAEAAEARQPKKQ